MSGYLEYGRQFVGIFDDLFPRAHVGAAQLKWLADLACSSNQVDVVEFGVGTGRIAVPLASALAERGSLRYLGVDVSPEMLTALQSVSSSVRIESVLADVSESVVAADADLVICVCGTISMLTTAAAQCATIHNAARTLRRGGKLVVEMHNPAFVRALHVQDRITLAVPYPGDRRVLVSFCELTYPLWRLDHCWVDDGTATFASETSRLITLAELDAFAQDAGLAVVSHSAGLDGAPISPQSPTVTAVYRRTEWVEEA